MGCQTHSHGWGDRPDGLNKNARLTLQGRFLLVERLTQQGWTVAQAAQAGGLSTSRAYHWLARYHGGGAAALADRGPAPQRCRNRTSAARVAAIGGLRRQRLSGPAIAKQLAMPVSTVGKVLRRLGIGKLAALEPKPAVVRYQRERPGDLIHIDVKKLGRVQAVGHRITGDPRDRRRMRAGNTCMSASMRPRPWLIARCWLTSARTARLHFSTWR